MFRYQRMKHTALCRSGLGSRFNFLHFQSAHLLGKTEEVDKSFRVVVVIEIAGREGSEALVVEAVRRRSAGLNDIALVETELDFAGDIFLGRLDECLLRLAKRSLASSLSRSAWNRS